MKRYMSVIICLIFICIICTGCDKSHKSSQNKNNSVNSNDSSKPIHNNSSITGSGESTPTPEIKDNLVVIDGEFHLNYYDLFDEYNKAHTFGNFNISETWIDKIGSLITVRQKRRSVTRAICSLLAHIAV